MIATTTASDLVEVLRGIVRAGRAVQHTADDGLHNAPAALLGLLAREGEQRMGRLAGALDVDPSVVSRQVAMLCAAGLVSRRPDPEDGRASLLGLTDSGRACLDQHRAQWAHRLTAALAHWDDNDATQLLTLLRRLSADVRGNLVEERSSPPPDSELRAG
ncbi:MarR family winged helix-turn-helix transcriptional regulator [Actinokineospora sp. PR83]|uniref:MarR family winged helix-turn-helix transcriptional regulator n=1 Tax=Actinokineospora sp. PR83 TaxID=2884908 RepID=UPI001F2DEA07|nr:MarR family winged helix-turn-helix transcriptional regulator [Actinokineospora sp. PR83]MCG8915993.1 MarR family winged helix-turn-helix transcriptional regulator [Actinokineospora sp. PR83]